MRASVARAYDRRWMTKHLRNIVDVVVGYSDRNDSRIQIVFEHPFGQRIRGMKSALLSKLR